MKPVMNLVLIAIAAVVCSGCVEEEYYTSSTHTNMYYTDVTPHDYGYRSSHSHQTVVTQTPPAPTVVYNMNGSRHHRHEQSIVRVTQTPPAPVERAPVVSRSVVSVTQTPAAPVEAAPAPVSVAATTVTPSAPPSDDEEMTVASNHTAVTSTPQAPE
jgi:hypothetical protein